ncbi:MAG TPA: hypothetical protein VK752_18345 [Bryobacteraceae bacterium]|jgi:hypothetical protein|nr:hypothetical protein [Bryobacteraceae bacterium]
MRKWAWWTALAVVILGVAAVFLYGPLFPWSAVKPGYTHFTLHRADVYYPAGSELDDAYRQLDSFIDEAETFHRLKMPDRITAIAPRTWKTFHRQAPWQTGDAIGALTLQTGTVIFITPKIAEKHFDTGEFLRHELSHAILDQNMTLWRGRKMNRQPWLYEGLAVDFGRQKSYLTEEEFIARAQTQPLAPAFDGDNSDMRFNYVAWKDFLEYIIKTRGRDKFQDYLLRVMQNPDDARAVFPEFFGVSFDGAVGEFQSKLRESHGL